MSLHNGAVEVLNTHVDRHIVKFRIERNFVFQVSLELGSIRAILNATVALRILHKPFPHDFATKPTEQKELVVKVSLPKATVFLRRLLL